MEGRKVSQGYGYRLSYPGKEDYDLQGSTKAVGVSFVDFLILNVAQSHFGGYVSHKGRGTLTNHFNCV